jgi:hypothetical protein
VELTRRQQTLLCVLALGIVALVADRLTSGPASVQAARTPTNPPPAVAGADTVEAGPEVEASIEAPPLLHRMRGLPEAGDFERVITIDAFRPPSSWIVPPVEEATPPEDESRAERFRRSHKLSAVLNGPAGECAVIGGRTILVGQQFDGFVLESVSSRSAVFRSEQFEVVLHMPDPAAGRSGNSRK